MIKENKSITHLRVKFCIERISFDKNLLLESDICQRMYCPKTRRFDLHIVDNTNQVCIPKKKRLTYY